MVVGGWYEMILGTRFVDLVNNPLVVSGISNFTVTNYTGTWHEYSRLFLVPEAYGKMIHIVIELYLELRICRKMCPSHLQ